MFFTFMIMYCWNVFCLPNAKADTHTHTYLKELSYKDFFKKKQKPNEFILIKNAKASKMAKWIKALATNPNDPS